jgi:hypothetical protein
MKTLRARFIGLCGLMVLLAATLAPPVAKAICPIIRVTCHPSGDTHFCFGTASEGKCSYDESCLTTC